MSRLNTLTTLVSAGYPVWYAYGVSRGVIDTSTGLAKDLCVPSHGCDTGVIQITYKKPCLPCTAPKKPCGKSNMNYVEELYDEVYRKEKGT